jgi:dipeptidase E
MRLLLGSGGLRTPERKQIYFDEMALLFAGCENVVFIPYASNDHSSSSARMIEFSAASGIQMRGIESFSDPVEAIRAADGLYVGGGNTFLLTKGLHENGLIDIVVERVAAGMPYMGVSAGSNVACPTLKTTNDMPIVMPPTFETFDLVPFQINAHYHAGSIWLADGDGHVQHFGETRTQRISEFHQHNTAPVDCSSERTRPSFNRVKNRSPSLRAPGSISPCISAESWVPRG